MSRASEWVKAANSRPALSIPHDSRHHLDMRISLTDDGGVHIYISSPVDANQITVAPAQAVKMAHWILDTFGETQ